MKEFLAVALNTIYYQDQKRRLVPQTEVILVHHEPNYGVDADGQLTQNAVISEQRFIAGAAGLRFLAARLNEFADHLDQSRTDLQNDSEPAPKLDLPE